MKNKTKNPLYVVKGKDVEPADGILDLLVKKLNLQPVIELLDFLFKMLLEQVDSYPKFKAVSEFIERIVARILLFKNFSFA